MFQYLTSPTALRVSISQVHNYGTVDYEQKPSLKWIDLYRRVSRMEDPSLSAAAVLDHWEKEQKRLHKWEVCCVAKQLRKFRFYKLALDVYDWIAAQRERFNFHSSDAAILLDLMGKARGVSFAEDYFSGLSEELKDKRTYCALLNAYAHAKMKHKAEALFKTMTNSGYAADSLVFNVMMTLYTNIGEHKEIIALINEMKGKQIKLDTYSYNIWITACAALGDVDGMEQVLELMNHDPGVNATWTTYSTLATMYIKLGKVDKAEKYMKDAETRMVGQGRASFNYLISLYSLVGKKEDVYRVWEWYKSSFGEMLNSGYSSMLSALIKLNDIDGAEKLYNEWVTSTSRFDPKICNILVSYYINQGLVEEAESCLERLLDQGGAPGAYTLGLLADGYISKKQISKALSCLQEAASIVKPLGRKWRPRPATVANFLVVCGEQNDQAGVESLVEVLKKVNCLEIEAYKSLISTHEGITSSEKTKS